MLKAKVVGVRKETPDIKSFEVVAANGRELPRANPGSHIDVQAGDSIGNADRPLLRQYSLCQSPDEETLFRFAVKREPLSRGGSVWLHDAVQVGDLLNIGEPRSNFSPVVGAAMHVLVAGGIGITPMLSIAQFLHKTSQPFQLHYFARSTQHAAFCDLLSTSPYRDSVVFHFGLSSEVTKEHVGEIVAARPEGAHLYVCGPPPFMTMVQALAEPRWPAHAVHREYFGAAAPNSACDTAFSVRLARSGQTLAVPPGVTILEVLETAGTIIDSSCRQGACGTCIATVLDGVPDHRDRFLLPDEQTEGKCVVTCVSRALTKELLLDL